MDGILIDGSYLRILAGKYQVPVGTVEKDLTVTVILSVISRFQKLSQMTFKGKTMIHSKKSTFLKHDFLRI